MAAPAETREHAYYSKIETLTLQPEFRRVGESLTSK
jgi:hypothetical protein